MKVLAIPGSNSSTSINRRLVSFAAQSIGDAEVTIVDLNNFEMPIFSIDIEKRDGIPKLAYNFKKLIKDADQILISFAEHNGSYSTAFKNIMDWISRIEGDTWESKPFFLMATSPGGRGGKTVLEAAVNTFSHMGARVISHFSLPSFYQNFEESTGIRNTDLRIEFERQLDCFIAADS